MTRPFTIFACSLWYRWYANYARRFAEQDISDVLFVEESTNVVRNYRVKEQLEHFKQCIASMTVKDPGKCKEILNEAFKYNEKAQQYIKDGKEAFENIEESVDFLLNLALYSTIFPHFVVLGLESLRVENQELRELSEKLRSVSYYPQVIQNVIVPMAQDILKDLGIKNPEEVVDLVTYDEILAKDISKLNERIKAREEMKQFVYQVVEGKQNISWAEDSRSIIEEIEKFKNEKTGELKGQTAYPGRVKGIARIIRTMDGKGAIFNENDILISINSNPRLMDLINKSSAIVTDEGGVTCHAAIISRELKKPCVIGTRNATLVLNDGDTIEVDADNGIVRKI